MKARQRAPRGERPREIRLQLLWLWVLVVVLYFAWEAASYRGLFALMAEWQFDRLGQDLPTFNFCLLTMICAWPALLLFRRRPAAGQRLPSEQAERLAQARAFDLEARRTLYAARDYMHFLSGFTVALWFAGLIALLWTLTLPHSTANPRVYEPAQLKTQAPREGAAQLRGLLRYGRISSFSRGILFARRTALYAPLIPPKGSDGQIRYFIEFLPAERPDIHNGALITHREGILVRSDLPGALIRLYRYLGYRPAAGYHVLYVSLETMRWPYYIIAAQFILGGFVFAILALWQRGHVERLGDRIRQLSSGLAAETRPAPRSGAA